LEAQQVDKSDIDRYLGVIEERTIRHMNGARWLLRGYTKLLKEVGKDEALTVMTASTLQNQLEEKPISTWSSPEIHDLHAYEPMTLTVGECMTTDIFTVRPEDIIELVGQMMDWRRLRYLPVEDSRAKLVGLVTSRQILRELLKDEESKKALTVEDVMIKQPKTTTAETSIKQAMATMREIRIGALPVINENQELIGMITETDFLRITARLLDRLEGKDVNKEENS
jgi:CBS domain-containing protein